MRSYFISLLGLATQVGLINAQEIVNGQIYTPGIAIINSPQPNTPLGGDTLHISIDISANGRLQVPPYPSDFLSGFHNITIFLSSYETGRNFTVTNGTATANNSTLGDIIQQEEGSTVKHVNWIWPDCLVGTGAPANSDSDRGLYNISIRQNFRLNGTEQYTIFDLPIQITNSIPENANRSSCDSLNNLLLSEEELRSSASNFTMVPGSAIEIKGGASGMAGVRTGVAWLALGSIGLFFAL